MGEISEKTRINISLGAIAVGLPVLIAISGWFYGVPSIEYVNTKIADVEQRVELEIAGLQTKQECIYLRQQIDRLEDWIYEHPDSDTGRIADKERQKKRHQDRYDALLCDAKYKL